MIKTGTYKQISEGPLKINFKEAAAYRDALEESCILAITDQNGIIQHVNDNFCRISKYSRKELIGKDHRIINSVYHPEEFIRELWETIASGKIWKGELKNKAKDGSIYWVDTTIVPFLNDDDKPYQYLEIRADITARRKTEQQLINASKEKENILNRISDAVVSVDNEWRYTFLNDAAMATHPCSKDETLGKVIWDVHPEMEKTIFWDKYQEAMRTKKIVELESHYAAMNRWFSVKVYPSSEGLTIFYNDITESKMAERDLLKTFIANKELLYQNEEKEKRAAELIVANRELVFQSAEKEKRAAELIVANEELVFQNGEKEKRAAELIIANKELVFQSEEKEKRAAELIIANKELVFQNEEKEKRAAELIVANKELHFQSQEKEKRAAELIVANKELGFQNAEKEKRAAELFIANKELAFESKEKEKRAAELIVANKELVIQNEEKENRTIELIKAEEQLKEANQELESFSYSVSHDLRSPLRAINGYARMLEEDYNGLFDDEGKRLLAVVQENAKKMGALIDDLLAFSRMGRKEINKSKTDMTTLAESACDELNKCSAYNAKINISELHPVMADYTLMNQVWMNLLSNAVKYSSNTQNPVVEVKSEEKNSEVIYSVSDNGAGFNMKYVGKLFGVFQRLHDVEEFEGTGVGLALVHRIIEKHGGKIWAEGEVGKGATFYFSLPAVQEDLPA